MGKGPKTAAALITLSVLRLCADGEAPLPEADLNISEIVSRMAMMDETRLQSLQKYSSIRRYTLENAKFGTFSEITARISYEQPGNKRVEILMQRGPVVIRKGVLDRLIKTELEASQPGLRAATRIGAENYSFSLVGMEEQNGRLCYALQVEPRAPTKYLFTGRIWVDAEDFAVTRIEGSPAVKPSIWIRKTVFVHVYKKVGSFWLPESNNSESDVRVYGKTIVKVDYGDYQINLPASAPASTVSPVNTPRPGGNQ